MNAEIEIRGERLVLRPDRSLFWPGRRTLVIADLHFGKEAVFRAAGVPIPGGPDSTLSRLASAIEDTHATRLAVLGDFWHAPTGRTEAILGELDAWRHARPSLEIELLRGNHDRAGPPPRSWAEGWKPFVHEPPFVFTHHPEPSTLGYVLAGHLHPGFVLGGRGRERMRLPCFWFAHDVGVLPAFGDFTGSATVLLQPGTEVYAITHDSVIAVRRPNASNSNRRG